MKALQELVGRFNVRRLRRQKKQVDEKIAAENELRPSI